MAASSPLSRLSLRSSLILCITAIILIVIMFLMAAAYAQAHSWTVRQDHEQALFTEMYLKESILLADRGLSLYDSTLDSRMEEAFSGYLSAYRASGGDISRMDLPTVRDALGADFRGQLDLYIINESGVIVASTVPEVMYLDFKNYPEFFRSITRIREGDEFVADRVVRSVMNTSEGTVSGQLRKFAFFPTPDHRYLLEMGLVMEGFENQRSELSYVEVTRRIQEMNPSIELIRIFDVNGNLLLERGVNPHTGVNQTLIGEIFTTGRDMEIPGQDGNRRLHYIFIDLRESSTASDMSLVAEITYTQEPLRRVLSQILIYYTLIGFIAVVMGITMAYVIARFLTTPITEILEDVSKIAEGDLGHTIRSMPNPEFRRLEESINMMIGKIQQFSQEIEREKAEIRIAAEIQRTFLPREIPESARFEIAAMNIPAQEVGGDFYDFISLDERSLGLVIADVAGKGIPAALFMALSRSILRAIATADQRVEETIEESNSLIAADAAAGMFVTLFYCILDRETGEAMYVNAGHNPPLHYSWKENRLRTLLPTGMAMGVMPDLSYSVGHFTLDTGDLLVLYTDGVTEAFNQNGEEFGEERLMNAVYASRDMSAGEILDAIFRQVTGFTGGAMQSDDITLVIVRCRK
ncbi:MAG: Stage II sporulation protein E (SpoIIE) [Methanoregulaceae archaeon PtaU1.Bin059]|nr:MAG: Stage II sporulation protein E (SpoIIE) [Methanoregulaceae archaeon PtaB.Bin152]OPY42425.1 MAG: Stage II sporulation protein E (SpoIIE) [Methanoregulaceae archaeon PtaU1.Bin059]